MCDLGTTRTKYDLSLRRHETGDARKSFTQITALCSPVLFLTRISCTGGEEGEVPRINVEDAWFDDPRRLVLKERIGLVADAVALTIWRLAQQYYRKGTMVVPEELFDLIPHSKDFEAVGLARRSEDGVYVRGSTEQFNWIDGKKRIGKKGGLVSAQRPRNEKGQLLPKHQLGESQATAKQGPSKNQASSSSSSSKRIKNNMRPKADPLVSKIRDFFIAKYKAKYEFEPQWKGKEGKHAKALSSWIKSNCNGTGPESFTENLISNYLKSSGAWVEEAKHPFIGLVNYPQNYAGRKKPSTTGPLELV